MLLFYWINLYRRFWIKILEYKNLNVLKVYVCSYACLHSAVHTLFSQPTLLSFMFCFHQCTDFSPDEQRNKKTCKAMDATATETQHISPPHHLLFWSVHNFQIKQEYWKSSTSLWSDRGPVFPVFNIPHLQRFKFSNIWVITHCQP